MSIRKEQNDKRVAIVVSVGLHAFLLIAFLLLMAWRAPNPPHPEFGIELNFGMDQEGGGEIQPETSPGAVAEEEKPEEQETPQETQPQEEVKEQESAKENVESITSKEENPVVVKEEKKETPKEVVKETVTEAKPKVTPKEEKKEANKETVFVADKTTNKKGDPTTSEGNDPGKQGDKGKQTEEVNKSTIYDGIQGGGGGGDGFALSMPGWVFAEDPQKPKLPDNSEGSYEFEIMCDDRGDITGVKILKIGLSPQAAEILRQEIFNNSLRQTSEGKPPETSKGKVVFIVKSK